MKIAKRKLLVTTGVLLFVLVAAFFASGVVLAQSSPDFDLGCRGVMTAGGKSTVYPTASNVRLHSSVGQWYAGRSEVPGARVILESGYILPVGQGFSAAAVVSAGDETLSAQTIVTDALFLPSVYAVRAIRFVRPCNWPWGTSTAVPGAD